MFARFLLLKMEVSCATRFARKRFVKIEAVFESPHPAAGYYQ